MTVKCTREGLVGKATASGWIIDKKVPFVALPCVDALYRFVRISNPATAKSCIAIVLDVGPWNEHDRAYVFEGARPQAESGKDFFGRLTNHAGIDLGEAVWSALGMTANSAVDWQFIA
jgi:hypothetical protein